MSNQFPVIAAISTPLAPAGLGVIRISGAGAASVAEKVFRPASRTRRLSDLPGASAYVQLTFRDGLCTAAALRTEGAA